MLVNYETTFIMTPVLTDTELKKQATGYVKSLKSNGAEIVHEYHWGLKQLAYPIRNKTTGFYFTVEYQSPSDAIAKLELALKRDDNVMRFLTVKLDKYAVDYNDRKKNGLIGRKAQDKLKESSEDSVKSETAEA